LFFPVMGGEYFDVGRWMLGVGRSRLVLASQRSTSMAAGSPCRPRSPPGGKHGRGSRPRRKRRAPLSDPASQSRPENNRLIDVECAANGAVFGTWPMQPKIPFTGSTDSALSLNFDLQAADRALGDAFNRDGRCPHGLDFGCDVARSAIDLRGAQRIAAVDEINLAGETREKERSSAALSRRQ